MKKVALYNPYLETKGGGEKVCLALAECLHKELDCEVYLVSHKNIDLDDLSRYFKLNLEGVKVLQVNFDTFFMKIIRRLSLPGRIRNIIFDKKISIAIKKEGFDVFINNCFQSNLPSPCRVGVYMCMFPQRLDTKSASINPVKRVYVVVASALSRLILHPAKKSPIDTYQFITANSAFTQSFIKKLWARDSELLFPICENMKQPGATKKEKVILHVGRFFENTGESHHKRQDFLLKTFAQLIDLHKKGWKIYFAGSVAQDVDALKYILNLIESARDLPVEFRFNCSFAELQSLYNKATIYWHATGFGASEEKHPEKQEHFGITTVEAMSAGCIPIVINAAGQKESVVQQENGFLWNNPEELLEYTRDVAALNKNEQTKLSHAAEQHAELFDSRAFSRNVQIVFSKVIS